MTQLLEKAFAEAKKLPEIEQNTLAKWLLNEFFSLKTTQKLTEEALIKYKKSKIV